MQAASYVYIGLGRLSAADQADVFPFPLFVSSSDLAL
jgi:hypothetical protein